MSDFQIRIAFWHIFTCMNKHRIISIPGPYKYDTIKTFFLNISNYENNIQRKMK